MALGFEIPKHLQGIISIFDKDSSLQA